MNEERRQPILEHLNELRWRLVKSAAALAVGAVVAFFFRDWLFELLESPYRLAIQDSDALAQFQVTEGFSVAMRLALFGGTLLASPILLYQLWAFVNPALTVRERKWTLPIVIALAVLFSGGVVFGYLILPRGLEFLLGIQSGLDPIIGVGSYISLTLRFLLVFGLAFEFPVFLFAAAASGLLSSQQLAKGRRWAVLIIVVLGAVVTPTGDPLTLLALSVPLYLLYELTIGLVKLILRK
ncbi:MAG: twin-arginine translocase subunit TatC [Acidimicrobiia bacterium]|nr:twin-arginine translocase subunit TatC [Acidimicrobiia bacterium]MDH3396799.1 twin-arginine translocase subunit TatC [Acidimicrobiia bacterium]